MMAVCSHCNQEKDDHLSCTFDQIQIGDNAWYDRDTEHYGEGDYCESCGVPNEAGNIHHYGCEIEKCPVCGEALATCECKRYWVRKHESGYRYLMVRL